MVEEASSYQGVLLPKFDFRFSQLELTVSSFHVIFTLCDVHNVVFIPCIYFYSKLQLQ